MTLTATSQTVGETGAEDYPGWHRKAVHWLRGDYDEGLYGLFLYDLIKSTPGIDTVLDIGTARGYSAVCCAKGLRDSGTGGVVHTVDINDPDREQDWSRSKLPDNDPLQDVGISVRDVVTQFHEPDKPPCIEFHHGDILRLLADGELPGEPDLVFHDGPHHYEPVYQAVRYYKEKRVDAIHVFDDCHLFDPVGDAWPRLPGVGEYRVTRYRFPGVARAVRDVIGEYDWERIAIVPDTDHAPIVALYP